MTALETSDDPRTPEDADTSAETTEPEPGTRLRFAAGLVGRTWLWFVVGCLVVTLLPIVIAWRPYVVESGSMEPRIHVGDVVLASPVDDPQALVGRVTVFTSPSKPDEVITHRVLRIQGGQLVTKGDANPTADSAHVPPADVRGMGRLLVRWVGLPLVWLQTGQWLFLLLFLASLAVGIAAVARDNEPDDGPEGPAEPGSPDPSDADADTDTDADAETDADQTATSAAPSARGLTASTLGHQVLRRLTRVPSGWPVRAALIVGCTLLLAVPSSFAAFAATTKSTNDVWTVPTYDYSTEVTNLGPYLYWRLEETGTATVAADSSGNGRTGTYNPSGAAANFTRLPAGGALVHDVPDNAVSLVSATACINTTSTTAVAGPTSLTEIIWFKAPATYTAGGKMIGFETPRTGVAAAGSGGTYDRHLYMDGNGRVWFGVYNGADFVISSGTGLNDNTWHMAVGTIGPGGQHLYIDGVQVASNANTVAEATTGWFRVGCGNLAGWADGWTGPNTPPASTTPTNYTFRGSLDEATVYTSQLTAAQVAYLYWVR